MAFLLIPKWYVTYALYVCIILYLLCTCRYPLGVLLHNENKLDEMSHVLCHYIQFVPTVEADGFLVLSNGSKIPFDDTRFDTRLLGGS